MNKVIAQVQIANKQSVWRMVCRECRSGVVDRLLMGVDNSVGRKGTISYVGNPVKYDISIFRGITYTLKTFLQTVFVITT